MKTPHDEGYDDRAEAHRELLDTLTESLLREAAGAPEEERTARAANTISDALIDGCQDVRLMRFLVRALLGGDWDRETYVQAALDLVDVAARRAVARELAR